MTPMLKLISPSSGAKASAFCYDKVVSHWRGVDLPDVCKRHRLGN